jgi:hypothetical protein
MVSRDYKIVNEIALLRSSLVRDVSKKISSKLVVGELIPNVMSNVGGTIFDQLLDKTEKYLLDYDFKTRI